MAGIASGVAQASAGNRDLVGLSTFDEEKTEGVAPARTKIHMIGILRRLAEAAGLQPSTKDVPTEHLTSRAYPLAQELYPELMNKKANGMPLGYDDARANAIAAQPEVQVRLDLGQGTAQATIWTCDLSHEYVTINGHYRT